MPLDDPLGYCQADAAAIVAAFTLGIIVAVLVGATVVLPLRLRAGAMRREIEE